MGWVTIVLFSAVCMYAIYNASLAYRQKFGNAIRICMTLTHAFILISSSMYLHLQTEWILEGLGAEIGTETDLEWLIFESLVSITYLCILHFARIYLKHPIHYNPASYHRRIDDPEHD